MQSLFYLSPSLTCRFLKWPDNIFWGVSTKYLRQYLNWYRVKEGLKGSAQLAKDFSLRTTEDMEACLKFGQINFLYLLILKSFRRANLKNGRAFKT